MKIHKIIFLFLVAAVVVLSCNQSRDKAQTNTAGGADTTKLQQAKWWESANIYEVNLRQYTSEGTIKAFAKHLPRLKAMGVEILWFMPITPIGIEGRKENEKQMGSYYAVRNYTAFGEEYGTMNDWKAFVKEAHERGFKVITDWVANHSAPDNPWVKSHPQFYAKDSAGNMIAPFDWTDVRKLDYSNKELRDTMINAMKFWLNETGIDGFRCDVAAEVPLDFWKDCITQLKAIRPDIFMLAEADKPELHTAGFDVTYAWQAMHAMKELYSGKYKLAQFDSVLQQNIKDFPAGAARMFFTTNHDENSWNGTEFEKFGNAAKAFAVLSSTYAQSIPLMYSGQELPNKKRLKFFVKDTIPWTGKYEMEPFYKTILNLRKTNPAFHYDASYKRLASAKDDVVYAYMREKEGKKGVVIFNFSNSGQKFTINDNSISGNPYNVFLNVNEAVNDKHEFSIEPWGYIVYAY